MSTTKAKANTKADTKTKTKTKAKTKGKATTTKYQHVDDIDHVLLRPDMYCGTFHPTTTTTYVIEPDTQAIVYKTITIVPALVHALEELRNNAADNMYNTRKKKADNARQTYIKMTLTPDGQAVVENDGEGIPVRKQQCKDRKLWVPEMCFGTLRTGSNYDDNEERVTGGRNGLGAKITNILSTQFQVETSHQRSKKCFSMTWTNNMRSPGTPLVVPHKDVSEPPSDFTRVTLQLDLKRMGVERIDEDTISLFRFRMHSLALKSTGLQFVEFNGERIPCTSYADFVCKFPVPDLPQYKYRHAASSTENDKTSVGGKDHGGDVDAASSASHPPSSPSTSESASVDEDVDMNAVSPDATEQSADGEEEEEKTKQAKDAHTLPVLIPRLRKGKERWKIAVVPNASAKRGQSYHVSFVNNMTTRGGTHVDVVMNQLVDHVKPLLKRRDNIPADKLRSWHISSTLRLFVHATIVNPSFDGQTKDVLQTAANKHGSSPIMTKSFFAEVADTIAPLVAQQCNTRTMLKLSTISGVRRKTHLAIPKLDDANWAGTARSRQCTLVLTEGDSAKQLVKKGFDILGRDKFGVFPLRGKMKNVLGKKMSLNVDKEREIVSVARILGLNFTDGPEAWERMRYGKVMIMTDQDVDGSHITGLILAYFYEMWPWLLRKPGFLSLFNTPIIRATPRSQKRRRNADALAEQLRAQGSVTVEHVSEEADGSRIFFTQPDFTAWSDEYLKRYPTVPRINDHFTLKYYKGLGTSTPAEAREYFKKLSERRIPIQAITDDNAAEVHKAIELAFAGSQSTARKKWVDEAASQEPIRYDARRGVSIPDIIYKEVSQYALANMQRCIPNIMDGLKPCQRKILWTAIDMNLDHKRDEMKLASFASAAVTTTAYHHGEKSIQDTAIKMAQDFVGARNIPLLEPVGQFGSRAAGGHDASAARYIATRMLRHTTALFRPEDKYVVPQQDDEGHMIEPAHLSPVLPLFALNAMKGIATGYSTSTIGYQLEDVVACVKSFAAQCLRQVPLDREHELTHDMLREIAKRAPFPGDVRPCVHGFRGDMRPVANSSTVKCEGILEWEAGSRFTRVKVTETVPYLWTDTFKQHLQNLMGTTSKHGKAWVKSFTQFGLSNRVGFNVVLTQDAKDRVGSNLDVLMEVFGLKSTIRVDFKLCNPSNTQCIGYKGGVTEALREWCVERYMLMRVRKRQMLQNLMYDSKIVPAKAKYIQAVRAGDIDLRRDDVPDQIHAKLGLPKVHEKTKLIVPVVVDEEDKKQHRSEDDEEEEEGEDEHATYNYLLNMNHKSISKARFHALERKAEELTRQYEALRDTHLSDMWTRDIERAVEAITHYWTSKQKEEEALLRRSTAKGKNRSSSSSSGRQGARAKRKPAAKRSRKSSSSSSSSFRTRPSKRPRKDNM